MLINTNRLVICLFASFLLQIINEQNPLQLGKIYSSYQRTGGVPLNRVQTGRLNFKERLILCYCPVTHQRFVRRGESGRNKARGAYFRKPRIELTWSSSRCPKQTQCLALPLLPHFLNQGSVTCSLGAHQGHRWAEVLVVYCNVRPRALHGTPQIKTIFYV